MQLTPIELRVIGCLIEKSLATPEHYPLSLNALTNACNQKSNREPVMNLSEIEVQDTVDRLLAKHLVVTQAGSTSRVAKYRHRFCNTEFGDLNFTPKEIGIICVLFLRGPQTPGELRTRTNRLCEFKDVHDTESVLNHLIESANGPYVLKLAREPGKRESRYIHCFSDSEQQAELHNNKEENYQAPTELVQDESRINLLEEKVELMQLELDELREKLQELVG